MPMRGSLDERLKAQPELLVNIQSAIHRDILQETAFPGMQDVPQHSLQMERQDEG